MVKKEGSVHISAKNKWAGHSEANTAAREVGESRATPSVRVPVLVLHRSKHSAEGEREGHSKRWCTGRRRCDACAAGRRRQSPQTSRCCTSLPCRVTSESVTARSVHNSWLPRFFTHPLSRTCASSFLEHVLPPGIPHVLSRAQCGNHGSYRVASVRARR